MGGRHLKQTRRSPVRAAALVAAGVVVVAGATIGILASTSSSRSGAPEAGPVVSTATTGAPNTEELTTTSRPPASSTATAPVTPSGAPSSLPSPTSSVPRPGTATSTPTPAGCTPAGTVKVATTSAFAPVVRAAASSACVTLDLVVDDTTAGAGLLRSGRVQVWIPDSREHAAVYDPAAATAAQSTASSPIVMAAAPVTAAQLNANAIAWATLLQPNALPPGFSVQVQSPADSGTALDLAGHLVALATAEGDHWAGLSTVSSTLSIVRPITDPAAPTPAGQIRMAEKRTLNPADAVVRTAEGVPALDYPWLQGAGTPAATALKAALLHADTARTRAGFQAPGTASLPVSGGAALTVLPQLDNGTRQTAAELLTGMTRQADVLTVLDESGSMDRFSDLEHGTASAVLNRLPDGSRNSVWAFGNQLAPPDDWYEYAPWTTLDVAGRAFVQSEIDKMHALPTGTGFYNTVVGAVAAARDAARPGVPAVVVMVTDGHNEDVVGGLDLAGAVAALKAGADPARPVHLLLLGIGDADTAALQQVAAAVGGSTTTLTGVDQVPGYFFTALGAA
jgi:Ca-activated chloride channel homolog